MYGQTSEDPYTRRGRGRDEMYEKNENLGIQQQTWECEEPTVNIIWNGKQISGHQSSGPTCKDLFSALSCPIEKHFNAPRTILDLC